MTTTTKRLITAALTALVAVPALSACDPSNADGVDERYFTGTVTGPVEKFSNTLTVEIDNVTHEIADVAGWRHQHCGNWEEVGTKQLTRTARNALPVGTPVYGYVANPGGNDGDEIEFIMDEIAEHEGDFIEPVSYLHLQSHKGPSISEGLVATGWAEPWVLWEGGPLAYRNAVVQKKHEGVLAAEGYEGTRAERFCGDREREAEHRREERRERRRAYFIRETAEAERRHDEVMRDLYDADLEAARRRAEGGGSGDGYTGNRCYDAGGETYYAC